jgi:hypothetical protein
MEIAIITVAREPNYLPATLASLMTTEFAELGASVRLLLYVGSPDTAYLASVRQSWVRENIDTLEMPSDRWPSIAERPSHTRAAYNFIRALVVEDLPPPSEEDLAERRGRSRVFRAHLDSVMGRMQIDRPDDDDDYQLVNDDLLLLEDDIVVKPGWFRYLQFTRSWDNIGGQFVTLYMDREISPAPGAVAHELEKPPNWYGTLGLLVPHKHRLPLARLAWARCMGDEHNSIAFDEAVREYIGITPDVKLFASIPSYVDHRGDVSAIAENSHHGPRRSPMY